MAEEPGHGEIDTSVRFEKQILFGKNELIEKRKFQFQGCLGILDRFDV